MSVSSVYNTYSVNLCVKDPECQFYDNLDLTIQNHRFDLTLTSRLRQALSPQKFVTFSKIFNCLKEQQQLNFIHILCALSCENIINLIEIFSYLNDGATEELCINFAEFLTNSSEPRVEAWIAFFLLSVEENNKNISKYSFVEFMKKFLSSPLEHKKVVHSNGQASKRLSNYKRYFKHSLQIKLEAIAMTTTLSLRNIQQILRVTHPTMPKVSRSTIGVWRRNKDKILARISQENRHFSNRSK